MRYSNVASRLFIGGNIDIPTEGVYLSAGPDPSPYIRESSLEIFGWVRGLKHRALGLTISVGETLLREIYINKFRGDVFVTDPAKNDRGICGFRFLVPFKALSARFQIDLNVVLQSIGQEKFATISGGWMQLALCPMTVCSVSILDAIRSAIIDLEIVGERTDVPS